MSAAWFAALLVIFLAFERSLPLWCIVVLTFGGLGWMAFFLGPSVYRWISGFSSNPLISTATRIFAVAMVLGWLLMLYGALVLWMPYFRESFAP